VEKFELVAEVFEGEGDTEVAGAGELDYGLEIVSLFAGEADLAVLEGALDLEVGFLDGFDDFPGFVAVEALLDVKLLGGASDGGDGRVFAVDVAEVDVAPGELSDDDFEEAGEFAGIDGGELYEDGGGLVDFGGAVFEVEPAGKFLAGLGKGVA